MGRRSDRIIECCLGIVANRKTRSIIVWCLVCFFFALGGGMIGGGAGSLGGLEPKDYRLTTCHIQSVTYSVIYSDNSTTNYSTTNCDYRVTTHLTGDRIWNWFGNCGFITPDAANICKNPATSKCSGPCYVIYESEARDSEPKEVSDVDKDVDGTALGLVLTTIGTVSMCLSCAGCFCMRLLFLTQQSQHSQATESLRHNVDPMRIGAAQAGDAPRSTSIDTEKYEVGVSGFLSFIGTMLTFFAVVGAIGGIYVFAVLMGFHNHRLTIRGKELSAAAAMGGLSISCLCVLCIVCIWLVICVLKKKLKQMLEHLAVSCDSEEAMQQMFAQKTIDQLRSGKGQKCQAVLLEAGVGEEQIERLLTAPPDQILDEAVILLAGRVLAEITSFMIEGVVRPQFKRQLTIFSISFLGFPATLVSVVLWLSAYCVEFAFPTAATVVALLMIVSCEALLLDWCKVYITVFSVLNLVQWGVIFALWGQHDLTALSMLLLILSTTHFWGWFIMSIIWVRYLKPLAEALFEYCLEDFRAKAWKGCGRQRDPQYLMRSKDDVINVGGCLGRKLGVDRLLTEEYGRV